MGVRVDQAWQDDAVFKPLDVRVWWHGNGGIGTHGDNPAAFIDQQGAVGNWRRVDRQQPGCGEPQRQRVSRSAAGQNGVARKPLVLSTSIVTESVVLAQPPGSRRRE